MTDALHDAIELARQRMDSALGQMLGTQEQAVQALGAALSRGETGDEVVTREFALLCAHLAVDPSAFYDLAALLAEEARSSVRSALEQLARLSDGPNALLRWCRESRLPRPRVEELDAALRAIRAARFSRSEVTEVVRDDVVARAREAAEVLSRRLSQDLPAELPSVAELETTVTAVAAAAEAASRFLSLRASFEAQDFRETALLRVLEATESLLLPLQDRVQSERERDVVAEAETLAVLTALEVATDALVRRRAVFGELLLLEATAAPESANLVGQVTLTPVPESARQGAVFEAQIAAHPSDTELRLLTVRPLSGWRESTQVMQELEIAHEENVWLLGQFEGQTPLVAWGTGVVGGEAYWPNIVDADPLSTPGEEVNWFVGTGALPPAADHPSKYAYVLDAGSFDLYWSDGSTWSLSATGVDPRRNRYLQAAGYPLAQHALIGSTIRIRSAGGLNRDFTVYDFGPFGGGSGFELAFGLQLTEHVSNEVNLPVEWELVDWAAELEGTTKRLRSPTAGWLQHLPPAEIRGRTVTLFAEGRGWTHRVVTDVRVVGTALELFLDEAVPKQEIWVFLPRNTAFPYPQSPYIQARAAAQEPLDLRAGDVLVTNVGGADVVTVVTQAFGEQATVATPLHTVAAFAAEATTFRTPGITRAWATVDDLAPVRAMRYRGVQVGDRLIPLPSLPWAALRPGFVEPVAAEMYVVTRLRLDGIEVRPVTEGTSSLPRAYERVAIWPGADTTTDLFHVSGLSTPDGLSEIERTARRLKGANNVSTQLDDIWPLRSVTFFMEGNPVDARRAWDNLVRLSVRKPVYAAPAPAELRVRLEEDSKRAQLTVTDTSVADGLLGGAPLLPLGGSAHSLLGRGEVVTLEAGTLPPGAVGPVPVLYTYPVAGNYAGPVTRGGPREFGFWAWATWRARRALETSPNLSELKEDLGRAFADLGTVSSHGYQGVLEALGAPAERRFRITLTDVPPNALLLEGADVVGVSAGVAPVRVVSVAGSLPVLDLVLTDFPDTALPATVTLADTTIAQAWREIRQAVAFLDAMDTALGSVIPPLNRVVSATATRLEAAGYRQAAQAVRGVDFSKWTRPGVLSDRTSASDRLTTLVSSLLTRRKSPLDE